MMNPKKLLEQRFIDAKIALIMNTPDEELDDVLIAAGFDPNDLERRGKKVIDKVLTSLQEGTDFISSLTLSTKKDIVKKLGIRHAVLEAIAEKRAIFESIPKRFIRELSDVIGVEPEDMMQSLKGPIRLVSASHKSDEAPTMPSQISFEKLLKDAAMSEEEIRNVMREET